MEFDLIWGHMPRFMEGVWTTIQLVGAALFLGGLLAIPMALVRAYRHPLFNPPVWPVHLRLPGNAAVGPNLPDLLRPGPVRGRSRERPLVLPQGSLLVRAVGLHAEHRGLHHRDLPRRHRGRALRPRWRRPRPRACRRSRGCAGSSCRERSAGPCRPTPTRSSSCSTARPSPASLPSSTSWAPGASSTASTTSPSRGSSRRARSISC